MGGLRYYRRVPADVREAIGRKAWTHSFGSRLSLPAIEHEARRLAAHHDNLIKRARAGEVIDKDLIAKAEGDASDWLKEPTAKLYEFMAYIAEQGGADGKAFLNAIENAGTYQPTNAMTVSEAYSRDLEQHGGERREEPIKSAVDGFIAAAGDKPVTQIARGDVVAWLSAMEAKGFAPGTIQRRLGSMRALLNRAFLDCEIDAKNPFEKHKVKSGGGTADDGLPFNGAMLAKIDSYLTANQRLGHETRNIIRMMKGTGAGPAEIGGLVLSDVSLDSEIPYIWVRANAVRGLKTGDVRDRRIPLIGEALEAAKDAKARAKNADPDTTQLFETFGKGGRGADWISSKVNKAIRAAGVPNSRRLTGYSYRHTMKEALRSGGIADHVQRRLLGHAGQGVADRYGSRHARLAEARDAIAAAMNYLGDVDGAIYRADEMV